jgi:hypothetical protein
VLSRGTIAAVFLYTLVGIFGYVTFVNNPSGISPEVALADKNIL